MIKWDAEWEHLNMIFHKIKWNTVCELTVESRTKYKSTTRMYYSEWDKRDEYHKIRTLCKQDVKYCILYKKHQKGLANSCMCWFRHIIKKIVGITNKAFYGWPFQHISYYQTIDMSPKIIDKDCISGRGMAIVRAWSRERGARSGDFLF
jgi:hypothetical protein